MQTDEAGSPIFLHTWSDTVGEHVAFMRTVLCAYVGRWPRLVSLHPTRHAAEHVPTIVVMCVCLDMGLWTSAVAWPCIVLVRIAVQPYKVLFNCGCNLSSCDAGGHVFI